MLIISTISRRSSPSAPQPADVGAKATSHASLLQAAFKNFQSHRHEKYSDEVYDEYFDFDHDLFPHEVVQVFTPNSTRTLNPEYVLQGVDSILVDLRSPWGTG